MNKFITLLIILCHISPISAGTWDVTDVHFIDTNYKGSGTIIEHPDPDNSYVLTAKHVTDKLPKSARILHRNKIYPILLIIPSPTSDISLIKIPSKLEAAIIAKQDTIVTGNFRGNTTQHQTLSIQNRSLQLMENRGLIYECQGLAIPGDSGAALFNEQGEVSGVVVASAPQARYVEVVQLKEIRKLVFPKCKCKPCKCEVCKCTGEK